MKNIYFYLLGGLAFVGGASLLAKNKITEISSNFVDAIKQITYQVVSVKDVSINGVPFVNQNSVLRFKFNLRLYNPTSTNFNINSNQIEISRIDFLDRSGNVVIRTNPNLNSINLPANGESTIRNIQAEIPSTEVTNLVNLVGSGLNATDINLRISVKVAGREFTLN